MQGLQTVFDDSKSGTDRVRGGLDVASTLGDTPILSTAAKRWMPGLGVVNGALGATDDTKSTEDRIDSGVGATLSAVQLAAPRLSPHVAAGQLLGGQRQGEESGQGSGVYGGHRGQTKR